MERSNNETREARRLLQMTDAASEYSVEVEYDPTANCVTREGCEVQSRRKRLGQGLPWVEEIKLSVPKDGAVARHRAMRARSNG